MKDFPKSWAAQWIHLGASLAALAMLALMVFALVRGL